MKKFKQSNGITLIALVITIIVLLILAGVTIAMLTGQNGILNQAQNAKVETDEATAKEKIQVEVAGSHGGNGTIEIELLNINLKNINGLTYNNAVLSDTNKIDELPAEVSLDGYTFTIEENGNVLDMTNVNAINSKIGTVVNGYSAQDLQWQVFYADAKETFLISKTLANTGFAVPPERGIDKASDYEGSADVRKSEYGAKWNKKWLAKCTTDTANSGESTRRNAKATAYLCDSDNWTDYATDPANYAVGGPTIELLIASWNKSQDANVELSDSDITAAGSAYDKPSELYTSNPMSATIRNGVYNSGRHYWLASPSSYYYGVYLLNIHLDGKMWCHSLGGDYSCRISSASFNSNI